MSNMRQIARLAGVSLSTVSRALHDSPRIPELTREKVNAIARQLNYTLPGQQTERFAHGRIIGYIIHQRFAARNDPVVP
jgi:LacI family transcriptional regulator